MRTLKGCCCCLFQSNWHKTRICQNELPPSYTSNSTLCVWKENMVEPILPSSGPKLRIGGPSIGPTATKGTESGSELQFSSSGASMGLRCIQPYGFDGGCSRLSITGLSPLKPKKTSNHRLCREEATSDAFSNRKHRWLQV